MDIDKIKICLNEKLNEIYLIGKHGKTTYRSGAKSVEVLQAVSRMLRKSADKYEKQTAHKKGYFGYDMGRTGKLILIKPGYTFTVRKGYDKYEPPVQLNED